MVLVLLLMNPETTLFAKAMRPGGGFPESAPSTHVARNSCNLESGGKPSRQKFLISEGRAQPSTLAFLEDMHHIHLGTPVSQDIRDPAIQTSSYLGKSAPPAIQTRLLLEKKNPIKPNMRISREAHAPAIHALLFSGETRPLPLRLSEWWIVTY